MLLDGQRNLKSKCAFQFASVSKVDGCYFSLFSSQI